MDWEDIGFITGNQLRFKILACLKDRQKTPTAIMKEVEAALPHVSKALSQLQDRGFVECLNPKCRKNRFYGITQKGKSVLRDIGALTR